MRGSPQVSHHLKGKLDLPWWRDLGVAVQIRPSQPTRGENMTKYRLLIRMWVRQDKLYDTAKEAHEAGEKIAKPEDIAVERVDE